MLLSQYDTNNAGNANQREMQTESTNKLLAQSERRLRIKEKVYKKEAVEQAKTAYEMQKETSDLQKKLISAKKVSSCAFSLCVRARV